MHGTEEHVPSGSGPVDPAHLRRRALLALAVLLVPLIAASAVSVAYHRAPAVNARYVVALSQLVEGMAQLDGHVARIEAGREGDVAAPRATFIGALGLYGALRAADPDGDEIMDDDGMMDDDDPAMREELSARTAAAGIDPIALSERLGLLGHDMPDELAEVWEEDDDWTSARGDAPTLEASFADILLAAAPILADGRRDAAVVERFWAASGALSDAELAQVSAVLQRASEVAGRTPVLLALVVLGIALAAAAFAWIFVVRPLIRKILRTQAALAREAVAALAADRAKSEFLTTVSHELRTPMNGVIGAAQILETTPLDEDQTELVEVLMASAEGQMALIEDLLAFGEVEAGAIRLDVDAIDLPTLLREATAPARAAASAKGLALDVAVPEDAPTVTADPKRLRQVIVNLVGNAAKFTEEGRVEVAAALEPGEADHARLRIAVTDTGPGIAPDQHARIFERFTQADGSLRRGAGGTGLGLAISRAIAREMGGELHLTSAPGEGSTFTLEVPVGLAGDEAAPADARAAA